MPGITKKPNTKKAALTGVEETSALENKSKKKALLEISTDYISPHTDIASDSSAEADPMTAVPLKRTLSDQMNSSKGERLNFKEVPSSSSVSARKKSRSTSPVDILSLTRGPSLERVDSLASDEANVARLLAELCGHNVDLSSPKIALSGKTKYKSRKPSPFNDSDSGSESYGSRGISLSRTNSGISMGNVLISMGRDRSNSAEVFSGSTFSHMDRVQMRPRADSVGQLGIYSLEQRKAKIQKYIEKKKRRVWSKKIKYDVRKNFADSRVRVKGRFVRKEDEASKLTNNTTTSEAEGSVNGDAHEDTNDGDEDDEA